MKKLSGILIFWLPFYVMASGSIELDEVDIDLADSKSLRRGAKLYVTHCQSCHSAKHMRYARIGKDLGMSDEELINEIIVGPKTVFDSLTNAMDPKESQAWFLGVAPPDLSLIARSRGADWLYTYLRGFYLDDSRPYGVNNTVYKDVAMPNVLGVLQGQQQAIFEKQDGFEVMEKLQIVEPGSMSAEEFDEAMSDLVNFLVYVGEPSQLERVRMGKYVILFLLLFLVVAYLLKKEYWRDIH